MGYEPNKLKPWHEAVVDWFLQNPRGTNEECAKFFDVSYKFLGMLMCSDAFQEYKAIRYKAHHERVSDGIIHRVTALAEATLDTMHKRVADHPDTVPLDFLTDSAELTLQALGYGPKARGGEKHVVELNIHSAPPAVLAQAREDMQRIHNENTEDAEVLGDVSQPRSLTQDVQERLE